MTIVDLNGNTYDTDDLVTNRGYVTMFPAMLNDVAAVAQQCQDTLEDQLAALAGEQVTTSTTSRTIASSGSLTFTTADNLDTDVILPDQCNVKIYATASPANYMYGTVTSASGTTLTVTIYSSSGSGTFSAWTIFREGRIGSMDIAGLSVVTIDPAADHIPFRDVSGLVNRKATANSIVAAVVTGASTITVDPAADTVPVYDASGTSLGKATPNALLATTTAVRSNATATLTAGYTVTSYSAGPKSSGTFIPDPANGNIQYATNGGAHTLAPPSSDCSLVIQYTNNGSAGAITTSGFTKVSGSFTTTNGDDFMCYIVKCNGFSHLNIVKMQ